MKWGVTQGNRDPCHVAFAQVGYFSRYNNYIIKILLLASLWSLNRPKQNQCIVHMNK